MNSRFALFLFLVPLFSYGQTVALTINQQPVTFQDSIDLLPYLEVLSNTDANLSLEEILQLEDPFEPITDYPLIIGDKGTYWFRLTLKHPGSALQRYIFLLGHEQKVTFFNAGQEWRLGTMVPEKDKAINIKPGYFLRDEGYSNQVSLSIPPDSAQTVYIKTTRVFNKPLAVKFKLYTPDFWAQEMSIQARHFSQGLFQGIILGFILYHLLLFLTVRDLVYLYYCAYMFSIMVLTLGDFGYLQAAIFPDAPLTAWTIFLAFQYITGIMTFFFMQHFVNLKVLMPIWNQRVTWFIRANVLLLLLLAVAYAVTQDYNVIQFQKILIAPFAILGLLFCILLIRSKDTVALYFAVAGALLSFGVAANGILELLEKRGIALETPYVRYYILQVSTVAHLLTFSIGMGYRSRQIDLQKQRSIELNQLKTRLYTNITHEFRTPLTVIQGMSENLTGNPKAKQLIQRNSQNLLRLINQLLDLSKLDAGYLQVQYAQGNIIRYLEYLTESFYSMANERQIRLIFYSESDETIMDYDEEKIQHVIYNLLSNAIKFTPKGGEIILYVNQAGTPAHRYLHIQVKDNGIGIAYDKQSAIFDRFYQADDSSTRKEGGTGIGLALTKDLVKLMNGKLEVQSQPNKGTTFSVQLPITNVAPFQTASPSTLHLEMPNSPTPPVTAANLPADTPLLLLVEDNLDVRTYIEDLLHTQYQIITAEDGEEGIQKAFEHVPDIIISDVMMPGKNGYEVCKILKQDERSSHIPIILLTARAHIADKLEGLEQGADAYLTKPFNKAELLLRLDKLVEIRKKLQARYSKLDIALPTPHLNVEDAFLQKLQSCIHQHLADSDFGVAELAAAMQLSQVQLYRKVKALTDKNSSQYLRFMRLEKARQLLQKTDLTIAEVAYSVGFNDPNYFSRVFQQAFDLPPSHFRN